MTADKSPDEDSAIWEPAATFADRFEVTANEEIVRLTFGEGISDTATKYHSAVAMTRANAMELRDLLNEIFSPGDKPAADSEAKWSR